MEKRKRKKISIDTLSGLVKAERLINNRVKINMKDPEDLNMDIKLVINKKSYQAFFIKVGVPHTVCFVKNIHKVDAKDLGARICHHDRFAPAKTNVNFVQMTSRDHIKVRTYERGVEDETFACGTGSVASAIISALSSRDIKFNLQHVISVDTSGGESLRVYFVLSQDKITDVWLEGDAFFVYNGILNNI